jgi:hypothetical protein
MNIRLDATTKAVRHKLNPYLDIFLGGYICNIPYGVEALGSAARSDGVDALALPVASIVTGFVEDETDRVAAAV